MGGDVISVGMPEALQAARLKMATDRPYLAAALWALHPVAKPGIRTMAVDKWWRLYYDPAVVTRWSVEELAGVLYHEVSHLLRDHAARCEALHADPCTFNVAGDAEINDDLLGERIKLPDDPVVPASIGAQSGLLAEEYYQMLQAQKPAPQASGQGNAAGAQPGGATGSRPVAPSDPPGAMSTGAQPRVPAESGPGQKGEPGAGAAQAPVPGSGLCGSCAHGVKEPWEEGPPASGTQPGIGHTEAELIRRSVALAIQEHARSRGTVPGHWIRWAEAKLRPKVDWRRELAAAVRHALADVSGAVDYTYHRPSRRQGVMADVVLPALRRPAPEVAVIVDTSGSMSDGLLARALAETRGVLRAVGIHGARVLSVDAAVHTAQRVFRVEAVRLAGGGGTDMGVGLAAAERLQPVPDVAIVLTDGLTPWPEKRPRIRRVVVGLLADGQVPGWARAVRIRE